MSIPMIIVGAVIFFSAVILHECAHGWVAYKLGDDTAKKQGRLTLNPIKHFDPMGTFALPLLIIMINTLTGSSLIPIGLAKPVPVNYWNLRHPKRDMMWVGLSGPVTNVILAIFFSLFLRIPLPHLVGRVIVFAVTINLLLAVFNLIPIPPLDGSRFVMGLLPNKYAYHYSQLEPYGLIIVFILVPLGLFHRLIIPVVVQLAYYLGVP